MGKKTENTLKQNKTKSNNEIITDSKPEKKKTSFFHKIKSIAESNVVNYLVTIIIIIIAALKLIYTLPQFLNTLYYRASFYSQWIDGIVILSQFGFMITQIIIFRIYNLCQLYAIIFLGFEMFAYSIYASFHAYIIHTFSRRMYIDCMNNLIVTGETRAFENDYNYRCDTFIKDCVSYYEEKLDCPLILMQDKMENIMINRKMFLCQVIMILILIVAYHFKIANFLKHSNDISLFKKIRNQNSMKWYHDVLLDKEKEINIMKRDINISLNQINNYIEYDENEDKLIKTNNEGEEINFNNSNTDTIQESNNSNSEQIICQPSITKIVDDYNKAVQQESKSVNINIEFNKDGNINITKETN